jgi:murein DD-endopeptidase MepM/ murein hydrolase activator NlpD
MQLEVTGAKGDSLENVTGSLAGEPLHFHRDASGRLRAIAGIPFDAPDTLGTALIVRHASGNSDSVSVHIPVAHGEYPTEHLTVAPKFGTEPDSATRARIDRENAEAREIGQRSHDTPQLWHSAFVAPRPGRVTSRFGRGREFNGKVQSRHLGVDFAGHKGATVKATNRGVVALIGDFFLGGRVVYIDHGGGLVSGYLHLSRVDVHPGDTVSRGQVIGRVGDSGRVTGPHLHWAVRYGGVTVDGLSLLALCPSARSGCSSK